MQTPVVCVLVCCGCSGQAQGRQHLHRPRQPHVQREPGESRVLQHPTPAILSHVLLRLLLLLYVAAGASRSSVKCRVLIVEQW